MKLYVIILNVVFAALICGGNYLLLSPEQAGSKLFCSACFAAMGCLNAVFVLQNGGRKGFAVVMTAGLLLAAAGDMRINQSFAAGAALFAAGHVCFWLSGCILERLRWQDVLLTACVFVPSAAYILFGKGLTFAPASTQWICLGYALVISLMTGKMLGNFLLRPRPFTGLLLAGSLLFCFSDLMLMMGRFGSGSGPFGLLCMATYYPAEILLAHGIFHAADA